MYSALSHNYLFKLGESNGDPFGPQFCQPKSFKEMYIYQNSRWASNIVPYKRYINDLVLNWKGSRNMLDLSISHLNTNDWGLSLVSSVSDKSVEYFDLRLRQDNRFQGGGFF